MAQGNYNELAVKVEQLIRMVQNAFQTGQFDSAGANSKDDLLRIVQGGVSKKVTTEDLTIPAKNSTDSAKFDKSEGNYIGTPNAPITSLPIQLDNTNAVNSGFSIIWYKGAVITKDDFSGGTPVILNGENTEDVLCRIFIDYHDLGNAYSASIQTGFTGELPASLLPAPMTSFAGAQSELSVPSTLPAPMTSFAGAQSDL